MSDVTGQMNFYRECVRNLWNSYFRMPNPTRQQVDDAFRFDEISKLLFNELVLAKIGKLGATKRRGECWPFIRIEFVGEGCPALIAREDGRGYWDDPVNHLAGEVDLRFIEFHDWDEFDYIDFRYYKVKIAAFPAHPGLVGRDALVETCYCRAVLV